jgi:hypothetical protein
MGQLATRAQFAVIAALAGAGALLAAIGEQWGALGLFGVITLVASGGLARRGSRRVVTVRRDLASWLDAASAVEGRTVDDLVDRSVAEHRHRTGGASCG